MKVQPFLFIDLSTGIGGMRLGFERVGCHLAYPDGIARTLSARYYKDGLEILTPQNKNPRRLTPRECARLQGFPDEFQIVVSDTRAYKQFGNSVVVPLIAAVASLIVKAVTSRSEKSLL